MKYDLLLSPEASRQMSGRPNPVMKYQLDALSTVRYEAMLDEKTHGMTFRYPAKGLAFDVRMIDNELLAVSCEVSPGGGMTPVDRRVQTSWKPYWDAKSPRIKEMGLKTLVL